MAHRKVYTPEFKQQAVQLAQQPGNTNQGIASDLGISQSALSSWIKAAKEPCFWPSQDRGLPG